MPKLLPAIHSIEGVFVFDQDNAPAHRARDTVQLLCCETPISSVAMWPTAVCSMMQEHVYQVPMRDTHKLRQQLIKTWANFQQSMVDDATDQRRKRREARIHAEGVHYEHLL